MLRRKLPRYSLNNQAQKARSQQHRTGHARTALVRSWSDWPCTDRIGTLLERDLHTSPCTLFIVFTEHPKKTQNQKQNMHVLQRLDAEVENTISLTKRRVQMRSLAVVATCCDCHLYRKEPGFFGSVGIPLRQTQEVIVGCSARFRVQELVARQSQSTPQFSV